MANPKGFSSTRIKNIGQKVLNLNNITFNKRLGSWIGRGFEVPYVSYCHPLGAIGVDALQIDELRR
jgi:hypothetical protein